MKEFIDILFNQNEGVCAGSLYENKIYDSKLVRDCEFFSINPISGYEDHGYKKKSEYDRFTPRRADVNVTAFRSFLFEMDNVPLEDQLDILDRSEIPFTSVVYSGGKSYHAILSLEVPLDGAHTDEGIRRYKKIWKRLAAKINLLSHSHGSNIVDPSCKNPSRFSRFPGYKAKDRKRQDIIRLRGRISQEDFDALLSSCPEVKDEVKLEKRDIEIKDEKHFFTLVSTGLKNQIRFPLWIKENGNYPEIFRITKWAIDEVGADEELVVDLFDKYVVDKCERVGYSRDRVLLAIRHGYES